MNERKPALPETRHGLEAAGYQFLNRTRCKGCGREIEWWRRVPGPPTPVEWVPEAQKMMNHFAVCPKREMFKKPPPPEKIQKREMALSKKQAKERERKEKERQREEAKGPKLF